MLRYSHPAFDEGESWGQYNTLLIDDSVLKASAQPFNHIEVPEYGKGDGKEETGDVANGVLAQVIRYLEAARYWSNVSAFVRERRFEVNQVGRWNRVRIQDQQYDQIEHSNIDEGVSL